MCDLIDVTIHLYMLLDQVEGHHVLCPPGYDDIRVLLGWYTELLKCRLDQGGVLVQDMLQVSAALGDVSQYSPDVS